MDSWSSWVLVRLRGDDMLSQLEEFERAQRFRLNDEYLAVDREIQIGFSGWIESGGEAGAMRVMPSLWPTGTGVGDNV
jgi:hypothetical protein